MKLVQKHLIKFNHKNYSVIDKLGFLSKNLYNCAVYLNRQADRGTSKLKSLCSMEYRHRLPKKISNI